MKAKLLMVGMAMLGVGLVAGYGITESRLTEREAIENPFGSKESELGNADAKLESLKEELANTEFRLKGTMKQLVYKERELKEVRTRQLDMDQLLAADGMINAEQLVAIKLHFNDLQREVAEGKFKGLALTPAYQELRKVFDHPDFDRLVRLNDVKAGK